MHQLLNVGLYTHFLFFFLKGKYILTPSPITYAEEQLFHFFGQLLGIAIRADVPLPLDLLPSFWKTLVGEPLDPDVDLQEADILTYNYVKKFENVSNFSSLFFRASPISTVFHQQLHLLTGSGQLCCSQSLEQGHKVFQFILCAGFYILMSSFSKSICQVQQDYSADF